MGFVSLGHGNDSIHSMTGGSNMTPVEIMRALQREIIQLRAEVERLRSVLKEMVAWDLNWADGLDENVERIKAMAEAALRGEEEK